MNGDDELRPSPAMLALGVITLVLSGYGLYGLMVTFGGFPAPLAAAAVAGLDLFAIAAGRHAVALARDGDSPALWLALVVLVVGISAAAQYSHIHLIGGPPIVGIVAAAFPCATVLLFHGSLRRAARLDGRRTHRVAPPRATFEPLLWVVYPRATWQAFKLAVADRSLGASGAFKIGIAVTSRERDRADAQEGGRRDVDLWAVLGALSTLPALTGHPPADVPDMSGGRPVSTASLVRAAIAAGCTDLDAVTEHVRRTAPAAPADTIRRAYARATTDEAAS